MQHAFTELRTDPNYADPLNFPPCKCGNPICPEVLMAKDNSKHTVAAAQERRDQYCDDSGVEGDGERQARVANTILNKQSAAEDNPFPAPSE